MRKKLVAVAIGSYGDVHPFVVHGKEIKENKNYTIESLKGV